jgi:threonine/homoserine/homoserine lactone efflux protein
LVWDGVIASAANPYWSIWWATIGLSFIALAQPLGVWGVTAFFAGHISSDYAWYGLVSALVAAGRNRLPDGFYKALVGVCAAALGVFGLLFIAHAVRELIG